MRLLEPSITTPGTATADAARAGKVSQFRRVIIRKILIIAEKILAVVFGIGILFPAVYGSLPPSPEVIEAINSGVKVHDVTPDPRDLATLIAIVFVPLTLIVQWWKWWFRIIGWLIWGIWVFVLLGVGPS